MTQLDPFVLLCGRRVLARRCGLHDRSSRSPNLAGQDVHLTVVHTADLHSRFFPYYFAPGRSTRARPRSEAGADFAVVGGIGRVSTVIKCIRGIYTGPPCDSLEPLIGPPAARSLHVDSGDIWEGAPVFNQFNGEVEMRAMSQLGLTAMALGNHEFDKGSVNLEEQYQKFGGFPILAANYEFSDPTDPTQPKLRRHHRRRTRSPTSAGVKIGVIGLGNLSSIQGIIEGGNSLGVRPHRRRRRRSPTRCSVAAPAGRRARRASRTSASTRTRASPPAPPRSRTRTPPLAIDGVDVIFGGHLHIVLNPPKDLPHIDATDGARHRPHRALPLGRVRQVRRPPRSRHPRRRSTNGARRHARARQGLHLQAHPHRRLDPGRSRRWTTCSSPTSSR